MLRTSEFSVPGLITREHRLTVPLDHTAPEDGRTIEIFAREVDVPDDTERPFLVFLQGGPGSESPRPLGRPRGPGWLTRALEDFRVLLLDQRGTGCSTPVGPASLRGMTAAEQAEHLSHFRADAIVADAEALRTALGSEPWSVLGQSFGGLCVTTYLSRAPEGLREALITGGIPPLGPDRIDEVYRHTYARTAERVTRHYARFPGDRERVLRLRELTAAGGTPLSWRRARSIGSRLGMSDGSESLHHLLELPFDSPAFLHDISDGLGVERNPLYALLHEACWADGGRTRWSAARTLPAAYDEDPALLTGEHVFPWTCADHPGLAPFAAAAEILAEHEWPRLYDPGRLAANTVPVAAAIYAEDMYVERVLSEETAARIGAMRPWLTSEYDHNGLRADGSLILGRLLDLVRGRA